MAYNMASELLYSRQKIIQHLFIFLGEWQSILIVEKILADNLVFLSFSENPI